MEKISVSTSGKMMAGVVLCVLGLGFWIGNYYPDLDIIALLNLEKNWPFILVVVGFYLIVKQYNDWKDDQ